MRKCAILFGMMVVLLAACAPQEEPLPTLIGLPTATETFTPSPTFTPTATFTPSPTATATLPATATATATSTVTPTATRTPTITVTPRPSASPTFTLTPTPSQTFTPPPTFTPIATATSVAPAILNFSSNITSGTPGGTAELRWQANADTAVLELLNNVGGVLTATTVPVLGNTTVVLPAAGAQAIYRLTVTRGGLNTTLSLAIALTPLCATPWFFTTTPTAAQGCAAAAPQVYSGSFQPFERGAFFRVTIGSLDRVCGLQNDLNLYTCYAYSVYGGTPIVTPVPGLQGPGAEFASPYYNQLAIGGTWTSVIGWGTALSAAQAFNLQLGLDNRWVIQLPIGLYAFDSSLTNGVLVKVQ